MLSKTMLSKSGKQISLKLPILQQGEEILTGKTKKFVPKGKQK
jgi:hypothetical protein